MLRAFRQCEIYMQKIVARVQFDSMTSRPENGKFSIPIGLYAGIRVMLAYGYARAHMYRTQCPSIYFRDSRISQPIPFHLAQSVLLRC